MEVTLRKANALQIAINEALKGLEFTEVVILNEFQNAQDEIKNARDKFMANLTRRSKLLSALYEIRKEVSSTNCTHGIDHRLAYVARLEKEINFYTPYSKTTPQTDMAVINGKLEKIRNRAGEDSLYGYRNNEVATNIFDPEMINHFREMVAVAKKQKQKLQDELLELNVRLEIKLSADAVTALTEENII
jgi:hypothetical protein